MTPSEALAHSAGAQPLGLSRPARDYSVFGGILRSELDFPELTPTRADSANWTLHVAAEPAPDVSSIPLGERRSGAEAYRLARTPNGLRLDYSHGGVFDISSDGHVIVWYRQAGASLELVRSIVLGPAVALALELSGFLCLHGSAVAIDGRAVAFLGAKHHGKSTLATALTRAGARLIGDDTLAISPGAPACIRPGVPSVRLWQDAARELSVHNVCARVTDGVKTTASGFARGVVLETEVELNALYILAPQRKEPQQCAVWRERLAPVPATIALAHQMKLADSLVGLRAAGGRLGTAAAVARAVPVWRLHAVRDFVLLPVIVEQLFGWHAAAGRAAAAVGNETTHTTMQRTTQEERL
jgi:hypothetical protein